MALPPNLRYELIVVFVALAVFAGCSVSPPPLLDDVDAVQAQIARNMIESGDWVTAHLNGVRYLEKSPLKYWTIAICFELLGQKDWVARIPIWISAVLLCWLVARMGGWAFSARAGLYAGLTLATCMGLFLFTRVLIPDIMLTLAVALALWAFLRALDPEELRPRLWAAVMAASIGTGLLLKGLIAVLFPVAVAFLYLLFTRQLLRRETWRALHPFSGLVLIALVALPWHVLAMLRNPPYFDFTMSSGPGQYRGFFWFYFINEQVLRFLSRRYPRDYNTVPRLYFWLFHLLWLFPWSAFLPALVKLPYRAQDRAGRLRLLALCWIGFVLVFFTFSSTQEYYSMPCYPALGLLLGCALAENGPWIRRGTLVIAALATLAAASVAIILFEVRGLAAPGDIARALAHHPDAYLLSLGHMGDLTLQSFAYLRVPLALAGVAFLIGAAGAWTLRGQRAVFAIAFMMVLFFHAARMAMVAFEPYLSTRPLAEAYLKAPPGQLIADNPYYEFSSVFFYANNQHVLLLNGRRNNLEYGSNAPDSPDVFIDDDKLRQLWPSPRRCYLIAEGLKVPRLEETVGRPALHLVAESGGKFLFTNHADPH